MISNSSFLSFPRKRESRYHPCENMEPNDNLDSCLRRNDILSNPIQTLSNGVVLLDYGPMHMFISAFENGKPVVGLAEEGAHFAMKVLEDLARFLPLLKRKSKGLEVKDAFPDVVRRTIEATKKMEEPDLTPLAAVAGTASDMVADFMFGKGGTKIIVDNGGDIAIRLREGEAARVGVKTEIEAKQPTYLISIDSTMGIGGVATSGLRGRSFTKGIASAATILSETASISDAAATVIGNLTNVEDANIARSLAEEVYPDTDLAGEWVTTGVGELSQEKVKEALSRGLSKAYSISQKGLIHGALIALQGEVVWTDSLNSWLTKL